MYIVYQTFYFSQHASKPISGFGILTFDSIMNYIDDTLNLDTLLIQIKAAVTARWYQLGEALGVSKESLDRFSSHPPEESIIEMLDQWLRSGPQRRTWRDVADALRKIGLQQLASDIETGMSGRL